MIAEILGEDVDVEFYPSSTLSKAQQEERVADRLLALQNFDGALAHYVKAQDLMERVLSETENVFAVESLEKQVEHLQRQPKVIQRKREDLAWKKRQESIERKIRAEQENAKVTKLAEINQPSILDQTDGKDQSISQSTLIENETDSVLACLKEGLVEEGGSFSYKTFLMKGFFHERSTSRESDETNSLEESQLSSDPKQVLIKKLEKQNKELMEHIQHLFLSLNSCEEENKHLKEQIKLQEQELETLRSQNMRDSVMNGNSVEIPLPFQSEYFGESPISSLPSLPPLDLPKQLLPDCNDEEQQDQFKIELE